MSKPRYIQCHMRAKNIVITSSNTGFYSNRYADFKMQKDHNASRIPLSRTFVDNDVHDVEVLMRDQPNAVIGTVWYLVKEPFKLPHDKWQEK